MITMTTHLYYSIARRPLASYLSINLFTINLVFFNPSPTLEKDNRQVALLLLYVINPVTKPDHI